MTARCVSRHAGALAVAWALVALAGCSGPPTRIVVGNSDTIIVNNVRPVRIPVRVFDARSHVLQDSGTHYQWTGGMPLSISSAGVTTCTQSGDATARASLGTLTTDFVIKCRPVRKVRALPMLNLVVGAPAQDIPFEAVGLDGKPVDLLAGQVTLDDSTIAVVEGTRIKARVEGQTGLKMRFGNRSAFAGVFSYQPAMSPEGLQPGRHVAVPVALGIGEMRKWRLAASPQFYFIAMLPDTDSRSMPRLAIVGASCSPGLGPHQYFCLARTDASLIVYHPGDTKSQERVSGNLAVWRQAWVQ